MRFLKRSFYLPGGTAALSLLILLLIRTATGNGQPLSSADSLTRIVQAHPFRDSNRVTALLQLADAVVYTEPATAMRHADEALEISNSLPWTKGIALSWRQ